MLDFMMHVHVHVHVHVHIHIHVHIHVHVHIHIHLAKHVLRCCAWSPRADLTVRVACLCLVPESRPDDRLWRLCFALLEVLPAGGTQK